MRRHQHLAWRLVALGFSLVNVAVAMQDPLSDEEKKQLEKFVNSPQWDGWKYDSKGNPFWGEEVNLTHFEKKMQGRRGMFFFMKASDHKCWEYRNMWNALESYWKNRSKVVLLAIVNCEGAGMVICGELLSDGIGAWRSRVPRFAWAPGPDRYLMKNVPIRDENVNYHTLNNFIKDRVQPLEEQEDELAAEIAEYERIHSAEHEDRLDEVKKEL
eukprot:gnl/TRDRNA2_/TRDRNA2_125585_c0_seq1.p1 gnl/TRDRNA2_/TRDRNA2_125585_c0~~gnl/TRDRNA2_/TRDRNA2_125585_c0_seq1.p1  ORF type:complete len:214 (+),score=28.26 gnl/TRDRNA2_/TRDRNA2_125585_c0_seq1:47-688(+)